MSDQISKLHVYSLGVVAANKPLDSHVIEVTPIEDLFMINGEITDNGVSLEAKGVDADGVAYTTTVKSSNTIRAHWMPVGQPNRKSAPDVRRGEAVMIYRFADTDKYYWVTYRDDMKLRKLETVIYAFSGTSNETDDVGPDTHYFLEISTHKKLIHFHTSKANGEPFVYDIQLNTGEGFLQIQDDIGNFISLDSKARQIELKNADDCHQDMDKTNYTVTVPDNTTFKTGKNTRIETGADTTIETTGNTIVNSGGDITMTAKGAATFNSLGGKTTINSSAPLYAKAPQLVLAGIDGGGGAEVQILGHLEVERLSTPTQIQCPSISGTAAGLSG